MSTRWPRSLRRTSSLSSRTSLPLLLIKCCRSEDRTVHQHQTDQQQVGQFDYIDVHLTVLPFSGIYFPFHHFFSLILYCNIVKLQTIQQVALYIIPHTYTGTDITTGTANIASLFSQKLFYARNKNFRSTTLVPVRPRLGCRTRCPRGI